MNEREFTHVDMFAGIGGFSFAFEAEGFRTVAYSEINPDKCLVYDHWFPGVRNLGDIKGITRNEVGWVDVLTGGVPCQPASALGQMRGTADERWLWPEAIRLVRLFRPRYGVFENPPSLLILEGGRAWNGIVSGLVAGGYDCWWDVFPAAAFGAGHLRERVLLVIADSAGRRDGNQSHEQLQTRREIAGCGNNGADALRERWERRQESEKRNVNHGQDAGWIKGDLRNFGIHEVDAAPHADRAGLQGHSWHGADGQGRTGSGRPVAPPDLRGRVRGADWWHEINTGVHVLAHGLPARLVEAAARCAGDAVVPQVIQPIARAIRHCLSHE